MKAVVSTSFSGIKDFQTEKVTRGNRRVGLKHDMTNSEPYVLECALNKKVDKVADNGDHILCMEIQILNLISNIIVY